jgi:hypothetical protein
MSRIDGLPWASSQRIAAEIAVRCDVELGAQVAEYIHKLRTERDDEARRARRAEDWKRRSIAARKGRKARAS